MPQKNDSKRQKRSVYLTMGFVFLGIVIPIFGGALLTNGEAWADSVFLDTLPNNCNGSWSKNVKTIPKEQTTTGREEKYEAMVCEKPAMEARIVNDGMYQMICNAKWSRSTVESGNTGGIPQINNHFECSDPEMKFDIVTDKDLTISPDGNSSGIVCAEITLAQGDGYYCGGNVGTLYPGGVPEEVKEEEQQQAKEKLESNKCFDESGNLGWIFCPIIQGIGQALGTIYENIVEPFLTIEPSLIEGTENNGTYMAWNIFRQFANWVFVILILFVIFSQITGIGIDNYGIKKILPKLIVMAILINLSYIICQLAVDLSNIIGSGINSMFTGIAAQLNTNASTPSLYFSGLVNLVSAAVGIVAIAGVAVAVVTTVIPGGWAVILPILLSMLSAVLSVFFMFVVLFVRKALAVLLVAISPLAFASYILPNTKKMLYDKWLNIFKGILLLYPLAGALIGGGLLASVIIVTAAESAMGSSSSGSEFQLFFTYLGGMLLQVVPFFFLPSLFKKSLSAIGDIGSKITGFGNRFSAGVNKGIRDSEAYQATQAKWAAGKPGGLRDRVAQKLPGFLGTKNALARNRMKYDRMMRHQGAYDAMFGEDYMLKTETTNVMRQIEASGEINNIGTEDGGGTDGKGLMGGLRRALMDGDKARIQAYTDALASKGGKGRDAIKSVWSKAAEDGGVKAEAAKAFANNILNNHSADIKPNSRSLYDLAGELSSKNLTEGQLSDMTVDNYISRNRNNLASSITAETLASMDEKELDSVLGEAGGYINELRSDVQDHVIRTAIEADSSSNKNFDGRRRQRIDAYRYHEQPTSSGILGPGERPMPPSGKNINL